MNYFAKTMAFASILTSLLWLNTAAAKTQELLNCSQLQAPKTVLLVHASWCSHCQSYVPTYEAVSNLPEMKSYTFYTKQHDKSGPVCGKAIKAVPITFVHNMGTSVKGGMSQDALIKFISNS